MSAEPAPASAPRPPKRRARRWPYVLLTLLALIAAGALAFEPLIEELVLRTAREQGVLLRLGRIELSWTELTLRDFSFTLEGAPALRGDVRRLTVRHDRGDIQALSAEGVALSVQGSAALVAVELSEWAARRPQLVGLPSEAREVSLQWRTDADAEPWLAIEGAQVAPAEDGASLEAEKARVAGVAIGPIGARWGRNAEHIRVGVGRADPEAAPLLVDIHRGSPHRATVELRPTKLDDLAAPLGVPLPIKGVTASGKAQLTFSELENGPVRGDIEARFAGYKPPVPPELSAFVFGDETTLSTKLALDGHRRKLTLSDTRVQHGGFKLKGGGQLLRHEQHATVHMELRAALSCAVLADAAAQTRLGPQLGQIIGGVARGAVDGSVGIRLVLDADSRRLDQAKLKHHVGLGCGLAALRKIPGWPNDLPNDLGALMGQLPALGPGGIFRARGDDGPDKKERSRPAAGKLRPSP